MLRAILVLLSACLWLHAIPTNPTLPQATMSATQPAVTGNTCDGGHPGLCVHSGDNLQTKYNAMSCGDQLVIDAGAAFTGAFTFNKQCMSGGVCTNWIQIVSSNLSSIPIPANPYLNSAVPPSAPNTANYATIQTTSMVYGVHLSNGTTPWSCLYMGGIEFTINGSPAYGGIAMAEGSETLTTQFGSYFIGDRLYLHGLPSDGTNVMQRGMIMAGDHVAVANSYFSNIYHTIADSQCIQGYAGSGIWTITNTYFSCATEMFIIGGTGATPGGSCTIASSPSPTTTTATVNSCTDPAGGSTSPQVGTCVMFYIGGTYVPANWVCVTANSSGALTFAPALSSAPDTGAAKIKWGQVPCDVTVEHNTFYRPRTWSPSSGTWDGLARPVKNFIENKTGCRVLYQGNWMENTWMNGQPMAANFNATDQTGGCPWCVASDITMQSNVLKNISGAVGVITSQSYTCLAPGTMNRVLVNNNLFWPVVSSTPLNAPPDPLIAGTTISNLMCTNNAGDAVGVAGGASDSIQFTHNLLIGSTNNNADNNTFFVISSGVSLALTNFVMENNIWEFDQYRFFSNLCTDGATCIAAKLAPSSYMDHNGVINSGAINGGQGVSDATLVTRYGSILNGTIFDTTSASNYSGVGFTNYSAVSTDYMNFKLTTGSAWHNAASDGKDLGVDFTALNTALGVSSGSGGRSVTAGSTVQAGNAVKQ
jgi:hypothetical protein